MKKKKKYITVLPQEQIDELLEMKKQLLEIKKMLEDAKKKEDEIKCQEENKAIIFK